MEKSWVCLLILIRLVLEFRPCRSQDSDDPELILRHIVDLQNDLMTKLTDVQNKINTMEESQKTTEESIKDVQNKINTMEESQKTTEESIKESQKTTEESIKDVQSRITAIEEQNLQCAKQQQVEELQTRFETDECKSKQHNCSEVASCSDKLVGYECSCLPGYSGDGFTCEDVDECLMGDITCGTNEVCLNLPGNWTCICPVGFMIEGNSCQDIDECSSGNFTCGIHESCLNQVGNYDCVCEKGYEKVEGDTCTDINECSSSLNNTCHKNANCTNIPGNYTCQCLAPLTGDGYNCSDLEMSCNSSHKLWLKDFGCIRLIDEKMTFDAATTKCKATGEKLLENIEKHHLETLKNHFYPTLSHGSSFDVWIGAKNEKWITSGEVIKKELWNSGYPDDRECVTIFLKSTHLGLWNYRCSDDRYTLCQLSE